MLSSRSVVSNASILELKDSLSYLVSHRWVFEGRRAPRHLYALLCLINSGLAIQSRGGRVPWFIELRIEIRRSFHRVAVKISHNLVIFLDSFAFPAAVREFPMLIINSIQITSPTRSPIYPELVHYLIW